LICLLQASEINNVSEVVIPTITPNGSATLSFVIPSKAEFPATQHWTGPRVRLSVRKGA
jgi:hypothetical protein